MVDANNLEKAILEVTLRAARDDWAPFSMGDLQNRLREFDSALGTSSGGEIADCICSLETRSLISARKPRGATFDPFTRTSDDQYRSQFFYIGSFGLKITHEGRKMLGNTEVKAMVSVDEKDDRLPLYRRRVFDADLERAAKDTLASGFPFALVMIDLDKFKTVNDTHGHPMGDEVLLAVSTTIANRARWKGKAYRYGGEEIAVLLPNYTKMEGIALAETIRVELEKSRVTEKGLKVTASFGVASAPEDARSAKDLLLCADNALISAKQRGRNLVRATGDTDEVKENRAPERKQPTPLGFSEDEQRAIRMTHFRGLRPECPKDGALLRIRELQSMDSTTPSLLVTCPGCGLQEMLHAQ
jgi:diguanylate cyclase (GGDEF)-like protein